MYMRNVVEERMSSYFFFFPFFFFLKKSILSLFSIMVREPCEIKKETQQRVAHSLGQRESCESREGGST